jgi:ATP synthase protein I
MLLAESLDHPIFRRLQDWARFFVGMQIILVALLSLFFWIWKGSNAAYSAILGGVTAILPNFYFARRLFVQTGAQAAKKIIRAFYRGEAIKLLLTAALCLLILKWIRVSGLPFFAGFIAAQMAFFWILLVK